MSKYRKLTESVRENRPSEVTDFSGDLDAISREGARRMLVSALDAEVTEFLGQQRYERTETSPELFAGDRALGLWGAIDKVYPKADHQRCWVHKMRNVLSYFPKRLQDEVKAGSRSRGRRTRPKETLLEKTIYTTLDRNSQRGER